LKVEELGIPNWLVNSLTAKGITGLYPPQEEAVRKGLLEGRNLLVATPTASGKTLLAALAAAKHLQNRGKTVYLTPLRALTSEKRDFFDELFSPFGRVAAVSRDYDQPEDWLKAYDIIVSTNEKMDSMLRHKAEWISGVTLVVVDEVHLISYIGRGPTLEIVIARLREEVPNAQLLLLSATIKNVEEVASFAEAEPVTSSWRPVPLKEAVLQHDRDTLYYPDGSEERVPLLSGDPVGSIVLNTLSVGGQAMVFAGSRRQAETTAQTLSPLLKTIPKDFEALKRISDDVFDGSDFSHRLAQCIRNGVAFHHAGLSHIQRRVVERGFRDGHIKAIVATPTLAAGINIPARAVIIPDVKRGGEEMSVMEYKQLCGRAGRPGYDKEGLAVIIAKNSRQRNLYMKRYVLGDLEPVTSRLQDQGSLRFHMLGLVASGYGNKDTINALLSKTLAMKQEGRSLLDRAHSALLYLEASKFIKSKDGSYTATRLGRRVAQLYIDPLTARIILARLDSIEQAGPKAEDQALLTISSTPDVEDLPHLQPALDWFPDSADLDNKAIAKATVLKAWINEMGEGSICDRFGAAPGDIHVLSESASWVSQAAVELAQMVGRKDASRLYLTLSERIKHGVKEELLPLVWIPGVGRVRARALYSAGFRKPEDIVQAGIDRLSRIPSIGEGLALKIAEAVRAGAGK
jgi:helicase